MKEFFGKVFAFLSNPKLDLWLSGVCLVASIHDLADGKTAWGLIGLAAAAFSAYIGWRDTVVADKQ